MELLCSVGSIYLLSLYPKYLATGLMGLSISISAVAIGMVGQGERLGMADIEGEQMGNAITFALPVALVLLLAVADNAKWLYLQNSKIVKNVLIAMCGVLLLLSTSRGAGLVAFVGIVVAVFYQSQQRRKIFVALFLMVCVLAVFLQTESGGKASEWFEKLTDSERNMKTKTSGRSEMWFLFPKVLADSPIWGVGPGLGKEAYAHYSWVDREVMFKKGHEMAWHAVYMHVGVETGMIGLTLLAIFMGKLIFKTLHYRRLTGQVIPLIGIVGYMTIGLTVTGVDGISGLFLGLAFLGTIPNKKITKEFQKPVQVGKSSKIHSSV
ncbi:O-antigen ligase family protein [Nitrospira sp.]